MSRPHHSSLYQAQHAERYARQDAIRAYQDRFGCRLVVVSSPIYPDTITFFEELLEDARADQPLHLMLNSPGGDGEVAVRLGRAAHAKCTDLTVIVPLAAKSAATILALCADHLIMGPASDLGPVDPQFMLRGQRLVAAKDLIRAVESAREAVHAAPAAYPLYAALLENVDAVLVEEARAELARSAELLEAALRCSGRRSDEEVASLLEALKPELVDTPKTHAALFGPPEAQRVGLPLVALDRAGEQWRSIWNLWVHYFQAIEALGGRVDVFEGERVSQLRPWRG